MDNWYSLKTAVTNQVILNGVAKRSGWSGHGANLILHVPLSLSLPHTLYMYSFGLRAKAPINQPVARPPGGKPGPARTPLPCCQMA